MTEKEKFIEEMKVRTMRFAVNVIKLCNTLKKGKASDVVSYQIVKAASSTAANYRAACRARSKSEFFSKICIVVEESDETEYWLELIKESVLSNNDELLNQLIKEANEITKIMSAAKNSTYKRT